MTMYARVEAARDGTYTAAVIGWPDLIANGHTEAEALAQLRQALTEKLAQARIVPLDIDAAEQPNPWLTLGDTLGNNPLLAEVTESIAAKRRRHDEAEAA
jgi:predicted RNase H-like HicB family nuclease